MPRAVDLTHAGPHAARIAVVDDDPLFLRVFAANLQSAGYQVACFGDPKQALASMLRGAPPDACVLDWNMPGLDGLALFRLLRTRGVAVPVLFLTSYGQPIFEEAALDCGFRRSRPGIPNVFRAPFQSDAAHQSDLMAPRMVSSRRPVPVMS